jgi:hypothetical protein
METVFFVLAIIGIWLVVLSYFVFRIYRFFRKLSVDVDKGNLIKLLEEIDEKQKDNFQGISEIRQEIKSIEKGALSHVQKVGFIRFNPFEELGGDHSFSVALLNGKGTGIIITGLHTRERTRVYVKNVKLGKSEVELSHEEKKALRLAQKEN